MKPSRLLLSIAVVAACARQAPRSGATASPAGHDMAAMNHEVDGHDMHAMGAAGSHSSAELAFLFPDGDDRGWSKLENGMQHSMGPDVPLAKLPVATRVELQRQLALTMDVSRK